ncbi:MAG: FAD-dependent oxidoreductase [Pseudonocardiales bacterium]|nr:FAD-dependent oxidoreductase [Pseudonocardiales bacterium]
MVGGGLLGLETARGLQAHGLAVHVVHAAQGLRNQQLDAQATLVLRRSLERLGMSVHTGTRTTAIQHGPDGAVTGVTFADGATLDVDMVVVAAGIRPNIGLAMVAGLETQRGIVVDDQLRSVDDDDIYTVGECVQHRGQVYGLVAPLGGVTSPAQLRRIADVAERYHIPMLKITGGQRIDLLGVRKEDLPKVWADLGMPSGYAYGKSFRTVKTCVGRDFCRFGLGDSTQLSIDIERRYQGLESPAKMKLAVSGCPRNCAESYVKDVGIVAVD